MNDKYKAFFNKYNGVPNVGNTPENKGQCVGLVMVFIADLGLPHIWGHAKDIYANAGSEYEKIPNTPEGVPQLGDIIVWNGRMGGGYGHIAIVEKATVDSFTSFDQNYPTGSAPRLVEHTYSSVIGWLRPKVATISNELATCLKLHSEAVTGLEQVKKQLKEKTDYIEIREEYVKRLEKAVDEKDAIISAQGRTIDTKSAELQTKTQQLLELQQELKQTSDSLAKKSEEVEQKELLRQKWYTEFVAKDKQFQEKKTELTNAQIAYTQKLNAIKTLDKIPLRDIFDEIVRRIKKGVNL